MPDTELSSSLLQPDGVRIATPTLKEMARFGYRIVLQGVFRCSYNGKLFDPLYLMDENGKTGKRHNYLQWTPTPPILESEDSALHRYVFRIPSEWEGKSVGVRVNVDRFVDEFLIPPSEVRASLSGEVRMTVLQTPLVVPLLPRIAPVAIPALLVAGGAAFVIRRRMRWGGLAHDLQQTLMSIEQKYRIARAAVSAETEFRTEHGRLFPFRDKIAALRDGAFGLARHIQRLRNSQQLVDRRTLEADIARFEQQLAALRDEAAQRDGEIILAEKRRTLSLIEDMEQNTSRCAMRLAKIEATLDAFALTLRHAQTQQSPQPVEETLRRQLDAEVTAIQDTARDMQAFEELRAQMMAQRTR
jgi:hypothetical protein